MTFVKSRGLIMLLFKLCRGQTTLRECIQQPGTIHYAIVAALAAGFIVSAITAQMGLSHGASSLLITGSVFIGALLGKLVVI